MHRAHRRSLTEGSIFWGMGAFFLPLLAGQIVSIVGSAVNTFILGKVIGSDALAASSAVAQPIAVAAAILNGLVVGLQVVLSKCFGSDDPAEAERGIASGLVVVCGAAALVGGGLMACMRPLLHAMKTPDDIFELSVRYAMVTLSYYVLTYLYQVLTTVFNAEGNGAAVMFFNVLNIVFQIGYVLLFVALLRWGLMGVLAASAATTFTNCAVCWGWMRGHTAHLHFVRGRVRPSAALMKRILAIGLPVGLQTVLINLGGVVRQAGVNEYLGTDYMAAVSASGQLASWLMAPITLWGTVLTVYCGQNLGAGRRDRLRAGVKLSLLVCLAYSALSIALVFPLARPVSACFTNRAELLPMAAEYAITLVLAYPFIAILNTMRCTLYGTGHGTASIVGGLCETSVNIFAGLWLIAHTGAMGANLSNPIAWVMSSIGFTAAVLILKKQGRLVPAAGPAAASA